MRGVKRYELFGEIALKNHTFIKQLVGGIQCNILPLFEYIDKTSQKNHQKSKNRDPKCCFRQSPIILFSLKATIKNHT